MKKIFISHNQDFGPTRALKHLINMFGGVGILVEDEPGAESPDKKAFRLLGNCEGFIALCTKDVTDHKTGDSYPKQNVVIEIQEWQRLHKSENMVIIKEKSCKLPALLGNPTYCEYSNETILDATCRALKEFQAMDLLTYEPRKDSASRSPGISISSDEEKILLHLVACPERTADLNSLKRELSLNDMRWNVAQNLLVNKHMIYIDYQPYQDDKVMIMPPGIDYLVKNDKIKP